jgi:hypothetical protein
LRANDILSLPSWQPGVPGLAGHADPRRSTFSGRSS